MSIETELFSYLSTYAGLTTLVSTRIYPVDAPQQPTYPYIVYFKVNNNRKYCHQGFANASTQLFQADCYATTYSDAKAIATQLITAIDSWYLTNTKVQAAFIDNEADVIEENVKTSETLKVYCVPIDFICYYG